MVPKTGSHSGSQKLRFCCYLLHLGKVRRVRNGPHFGSCLGTSFAQNTKKWANGGYPKIGTEKRSPSANLAVYLKIRRLPDSPPRARVFRTRNNNLSNNSNNNSNSCSSCGSMSIFALKIVQFGLRPVKKRMLLLVRVQELMIWHALGQGPANFLNISLVVQQAAIS